MKLNKLHISSFRGATKPVDIPFEKGKKITMIYAENGNGKSTIADALICLFTSDKGSIDDKSGTEARFIKSLDATNAKIELHTDKEVYSANLSGTSRDFVKSYHESIPELRYLRRSQIVDLLNRKATERYEKLKSYIDVSGLLKSGDELRKLVRDTDREVENLVSVIENSKTTLESIWLKEESPMGEVLVWAKAESEKDLTKEGNQLREVDNLSRQWTAIQNKYGEIQQSIITVGIAQKAHNAALEALQKLQEKNTTINADLLTLLTQAKKFIAGQQTIDACPVCDNSVEKNTVVKSLDEKIASMSAIGAAAIAVEKAKRDWDAKVAIQKRAVQLFSSLLVNYRSVIAKYKISVPEIAAFIDGITTDINTNYQCYQDNLTQLSTLSERIEAAKEKYTKSINHHNAIKEQYKSVSENLKLFDRKSKLSQAAEKALDIVEKSRKDFYDNKLLSISDEVERMYQQLHPDEGLGGIKLFLNPQYKTSLELQANFHTEEGITPQSVYSESHLDTLGICIFLALAKKYSKGDTILVLDDVVMSVDENHLDRFIKLLHEETEHFSQIIITTHYRPWKDRYRTHRAPGGKVHFIELRKWSKESGIRVQNGRVELQELELSLNDPTYFDRQVISSKSGIILENILDFLSDVYEYHLPKRKSLKYTLGELIDTLQPKYLKNIHSIHTVKQKDESCQIIEVEITFQLQPIVDALKRLLFIRNQVGAHFNLEQDASDDDVELFGRTTLELGKAIVCNETGQLPLIKTADHWKSKNGTVRLYPSEKI
jgi:ABC-type transport system involved in cytochrome c biogenesis ATPase subunit